MSNTDFIALQTNHRQPIVNMLMPKKNRDRIFEYLFKEGVCVAKKDFNQKTHNGIEGVTNLQVIKCCQVESVLCVQFNFVVLESCIARLRQGTVYMASLLLVSDQ